MALSLVAKPMLPLYPVQPDRQPTYPKALGPVFVGNPLRLVPFPQAHSSQATPDLVGRFRPQGAEAHPAEPSAGASYLQPNSKDTAASRNPALGTRFDVLA